MLAEDRAAVTMMDLALKAITLRLRELESALWQQPPEWRDRIIPQVQHLIERQRELETRLSRLRVEEQDTEIEASGAEEIYPAVQEALVFIRPDVVKIVRP